MKKWVFVFTLPLVFHSSLYGASFGETAATTLTRGGGAHAIGVGEAFVSVSGNIQTLAYNPAGMATLLNSELSASYTSGLVEDDLGTFSYGHRMPFGTLYLGGIYYDAGTIDLNLSNGFQGSRTAQQDLVGLLGFALGREFPFSLGVTGKAYRLELAEVVKETGYAFDSGFLWRTPLTGVNLGASIQNVGSDVKFETQSDPIPQTVRAGGSFGWNFGQYRIFEGMPFRIRLLTDGVKIKEEDWATHSGIEIIKDFTTDRYVGNASFRFGYVSDLQALNFGAGFRFAAISLDYALTIFDSNEADDNTHRFTLSYAFLKNDEYDASKLKKKTLTY